MAQLDTLKSLLGVVPESDAVLEFYLDSAKNVICDIRNSDSVETKYLTTQIKMAIELYNKRGAEGQVSHSEIGIGRIYGKADVSDALLNEVTPIIKTPYSATRIIT